MRHRILAAPLLAALLLSAPVHAQEEDGDTDSQLREGWGMMSDGSRMILEGLMDEMRPMIDEHMMPLLSELGAMIDDLNAYHPPEILPNGDIILRRRVPLDPDAPDETAEDGDQIDL